MMNNKWVGLILSLAALNNTSALAFDVEIDGLTGELETNLRSHLAAYDNYRLDRISQRQFRSVIDTALQPYGYYHSTFESTVTNDDHLKLEVVAGEPVRINTLDIRLDGAAAFDEEFLALLAQTPLQLGTVLNHQSYDALKSKLLSLAMRKGYFDAQFSVARMEVTPDHNLANIQLYLNSGDRYQFGEVTLHNNQIESSRTKGLATFEEGQAYEAHLVSEYQARLIETGWYRDVVLAPNFNGGTKSDQVPIDIYLTPNSKHIAQVGAGYSTNIGARGSLRWLQPWYNEQGHSFESKLEISEPEQSLLLGYKIPERDVINDYYGVRFEAKHTDYLDTLSVLGDLTFEKHWRLDDDWQSTVFLKYLYENYQQASDSNETQLTMPGIEFLYEPSREDITRVQHRHLYSVAYSSSNLLSDSQVLRIEGTSQLKWAIADNHRVLMRSYLGANFADSIEDVPSSLRFFAGGDNSIRGYKYNSISPKDEAGELTGGRFAATLGLDYQARLYGSLWGGVFYDVGDVFNESSQWKQGAGLSLEWNSKWLPIKLDIAKGKQSEDDYRLHLSFGTTFK